MAFSNTPQAEIAIRIWQPKAGITGPIYNRKKIVPIEYFSDSRYHAYVDFEFREMYEHMVQALKEQP